MLAITYDHYGDADVLHVTRDVPNPHPGPGQVRIRVCAAGVTPADGYLRSGALRDAVPLLFPHIPGMDAAGVVDELGADVTGVELGTEVFGFTPPQQSGGGWAEHAVLDAWVPKPAQLSWTQAGGAAANIETATRVLDALQVTAGSTLLIEGASGGVGTIAIQLAAARGAIVIGTASPRNHPLVESLGATPTEYGRGLADRIAVLAPNGVSAVLDAAGSGSLAQLVEIAGTPDKVVTIADFAASEHGVRLSTSAGPGSSREDGRAGLAVAAALATEGRLTVPVHAIYPYPDAADAHRESESRRARGKIVLTFPW